MKPEKPLFIPLKGCYFADFLYNRKNTEYRKYGARWNEKVCRIGRKVVLSCGYGKQNRMYASIKDFRKVPIWESKGKEDYIRCYGNDPIGFIAEIEIGFE